ncbi:hypothetical protein [Alicyclobacillus sp. SO9]|uniref:hypothetical protein n=1 Tax=Alicyclobacillus sp. SO9 TaxID=2665646 RepID=UPI0018E7DFC1|nr:hypothetical protein [Alicyclobacillus sp. SO9]QQE78560.1 hypothetical protein GI364_22300 [Alicyclobacillus sp. SO9]
MKKMKKRFTERDAEAHLRRIPRLRLDRKRKNEIMQRTLYQVHNDSFSNQSNGSHQHQHQRQDQDRPQNQPSKKRPWGPISATVAAFLLLGAGLLYANAKLGGGSTAHRHVQTSTPSENKPNDWMTNVQKRRLVAQAVANMYHGKPPKSASGDLGMQSVPIVSMSPAKDGSGQNAYQVKLKGTFTHNQLAAPYLSFMTTAGGSKVWDIKAMASSSQPQWTLTKTLQSKFRQFVYSGGNKNWTGLYRQASVNLSLENSATEETQLGSSHRSKGMIWYTGSGPVPKVSAYSVKGDSGSISARGKGEGSILQPTPEISLSLSGLGMDLPSNSVHVSITANGHKETFLLRDVTQKDAKPIPMMKVVSIKPQKGGLLIRVQRKTHPVKVAIDSKETQDGNGSNGPEASFIIRDAKAANSSVLNFATFNRQSGQFIRSISVKPQGRNLLVQLKLKSPVNTLNTGATGQYLGVALQNQPASIATVFHGNPPSVGKLPGWFVTDMLFAGYYEGTPMKPVTYSQMLPRKSEGKFLLSSPLDPKANPGESVTYTSYYGAVPLFGTIKKFTAKGASVPASKVHTGYVKEVKNGKTVKVKATLFDMTPNWGFGFANKQVIVYSQHRGFYTYTVYPVPTMFAH